MRHIYFLVISLIAFSTATASSALAATMTFGSSAPPAYTPSVYTEDGITMTSETGHFDIYGEFVGGTPTDNVGAIHHGNGGERVRFTFASGKFDLQSIDITGWLIRATGDLTGTFSSSTGTTHVISSSPGEPTGIIDFASLGGWSNLDWFTFGVPETVFSCSECSIVGFDDVTLSTPTAVPLPAALPLFAGGLGLLGLMGWRRKRKTAAAAV